MKKVIGLCVLAVAVLVTGCEEKAPTPQGVVKGNPDTSCITVSNFYGKRRNLKKSRQRREDYGVPGRSTGEELDPSHPLYPVCVPSYDVKAARK